MKFLDLYEFDENDDVFYECLRIAEDEFCNLIDYEDIFFYGQIIDEDSWINESEIDEEKTYCHCPVCNSLFELSEADKQLQNIVCPKCGEDGILADFRDKSQPLNEMCPQHIAYMQSYKDGYVLRLFIAYADYSERAYDDYTTLSCFPSMRFFEYGREYYEDGEIKYFINPTADYAEAEFVEVENLDDDGFWLANYDGDDSPFLYDLKDGSADKPTMNYLARHLSYKAFRALQKYGFKQITEAMIFSAKEFADSSKISEVLGVDYNRIIADVGVDISIKELFAARKLNALNVRATQQNINLMLDMERVQYLEGFKLTTDNARKVFKYLRNQQNRKQCKNIAGDYMDYISECIKLNFDTSDSRVMYPTDLLKAHAHTSSLIEIKANEENEIGILKAYAKYHKLCSYDNGKFCIIVPQSSEEIIYEGKTQSHCVGNYVARMANGEDIILFLRRSAAKDKPFYTMEIKPVMRKLDIVQCRGYKNEDESEEIRADVDKFLAEYESWFNGRSTTVKEDLKRIYYKAVRKSNGKYISAWDNKTEYVPGQILETETDKNPDRVAVKGIHIASLEFAQNYGGGWTDVAILELEVNINDIVIPDAKDQIRASRVKVLREVPFQEMGEWGAKRLTKTA